MNIIDEKRSDGSTFTVLYLVTEFLENVSITKNERVQFKNAYFKDAVTYARQNSCSGFYYRLLGYD